MSSDTTRTPLEIDSELADLYQQEQEALRRRFSTMDSLHDTVGDRGEYIGRRKVWRLTEAEVLERANSTEYTDQLMPYERTNLSRYLDRLAELDAKLTQTTQRRDDLDAEYERRGRWSRFFLVTSSDGHIHASMGCSTCRPRTEFGWLPELSGKTEAEAVEAHGPLLCSVCFPTAPVEWTVGKVKPAGCSGSGASVRAAGVKNYGQSSYATCPDCGKVVQVSVYGVLRKHKPQA